MNLQQKGDTPVSGCSSKPEAVSVGEYGEGMYTRAGYAPDIEQKAVFVDPISESSFNRVIAAWAKDGWTVTALTTVSEKTTIVVFERPMERNPVR